MGWIAFLDMLGTRQAVNSQDRPDALTAEERLERFFVAVGQHTYDRAKVHARFFSDSAYLFSENFEDLAGCLFNIKINLISYSIYFKAAILPGELQDQEWQPSGGWNDRGDSERIKGFRFGTAATLAYTLQERFPGIGVTVHKTDEKFRRKLKQVRLVHSLAFDVDRIISHKNHARREMYVEYFDIAHEIESSNSSKDASDNNPYGELDVKALVDLIYKDLRITSASYPRAVPKYFSLLITLAQSCTLSTLKIDKSRTPWRISNAPYLYEDLFQNPRWEYFASVVGYKELVSCCVSRLISAYLSENANIRLDRDAREIVDRFVDRASRRILPTKAEAASLAFLQIPNSICSDSAKRYLLEKWAPGGSTNNKSPPREETRQR